MFYIYSFVVGSIGDGQHLKHLKGGLLHAWKGVFIFYSSENSFVLVGQGLSGVSVNFAGKVGSPSLSTGG